MEDAEGAARIAELLGRTRAAQRDLVNGDSSAYAELFEHSFEATLYGPFGGMFQGWLEIAPRLAAAAALFAPITEESAIEPISTAVARDVVVLISRETNMVRLKTRARPLRWVLRSTHVYREGPRGWHLLHRHADALTERRSADETFAGLL